MAKPGIAAVALFQFFYAWNDYFGPQIYASENPARVDAVATAWSRSRARTTSTGTSPWPRRLLVMAPVIIVFFFAQRAFVEGVTLTGVKG